MLSRQARLTLKLYRKLLGLQKRSQQYNLPGFTEKDIDTGAEEAKKEEERYDLSGVDTSYCQKLGGVGENAAVDSYINPIAGVILLEVMKDGSWTLASQSYFHYVPKDNGVILDNVEHDDEVADELETLTGYNIDQIYAIWAKTKAEANDYKYVLCGKAYNKLDNSKFSMNKLKGGDPRDFKVDDPYSDFEASSNLNLLAPKFDLPTEFMAQQKKREKRTKALIMFEQFFKEAQIQ